MKLLTSQVFKNSIILITFLIACFYFSFHSASAQDIVSISSGEYAPFTGIKLNQNGFVNHVIKEVLS